MTIKLSEDVSRFLVEGRPYPFARVYGKRLINLASNESPFPPSPRVLSAIKRNLLTVNLYPVPRPKELLEKIARYVSAKTENIVIGNGSDELVDLVCRMFLNKGDVVLIPVPTFSFYEISVRLQGAKPIFWQLPDYQWRMGDMEKFAKKAKMVFLCRPNNPTGNSAPEEAVLRLLEMGKIVVVDEAYVEFSGNSLSRLVERWENLIVLRTFSKAFCLAGLRIGYAIAGAQISETMWKIKPPFSVNSLAIVAASAALDDIRYMQRVVEIVIREREKLKKRLRELGLEVLDSEANFLMVKTPLKADELCSILEKKGILIRSLSGFRGVGENWVRITVGRPVENRKLITTLERSLRCA